jgi:glyoxylase-like metal-dependent hydrolase (beta-lactamase superfamily II)
MIRLLFRAALTVALASAGVALAQPPNFDNVQIHVLPVRGNIYMLVGAGGNITVQVGPEGVLMVDTEFAPLAPKIMAEIRKLTPRPLHWIVNTHFHPDHIGGNDALARLSPRSDAEPLGIIAHENVLKRYPLSATPDLGSPMDEYFTPFKDMHFNGEAIFIYHEPNAHTDGDSVLLFRGSDVVATGDIFTPEGYPFIDREHGGSVQGEIAALNHILDLTVPAHSQEGGTYVVPGHGRLCDEVDVVEYRDMIVIVRDRIQDLIHKGMNLEQVRGAKPTLDYDGRFVDKNSFVKADAFIETIYKDLGGK